MIQAITRGFYRHYRGGIYFVYGISRNDDIGEELVIYESVQGVNSGAPRMRHRTLKEFAGPVPELSTGDDERLRFVRVHAW
jgi:hypothetical protein